VEFIVFAEKVSPFILFFVGKSRLKVYQKKYYIRLQLPLSCFGKKGKYGIKFYGNNLYSTLLYYICASTSFLGLFQDTQTSFNYISS
jgi:hypothetical protein